MDYPNVSGAIERHGNSVDADEMARNALFLRRSPMDARNQSAMEQPARTSISEAALEVVEAGQQLVVDRIELLRNDALRTVSRLQHQAVLFVAAAVLLMTAWIAFNGTATMFLAQRFSWVIAGSVIGSVNAIVGLAVLTWSAKRRTSGEVKWK